MYSNEILVTRIKERAAERGMKIGELCSACEINRNTFTQLNGKKGIAAATLYKLADELDCSTDYLLGRSDH